MELTNQTTDDIQALYLPVRGMYDVIGNSSILFKYRKKDHSDLSVRTNGSTYNSYLGYDYSNFPVELTSGRLSFKWQYTNGNRTCFNNIEFTRLLGSQYDGYGSVTNGGIRITDMMGEDADLYVKIDITKINLGLAYTTGSYHSMLVNDFLIQYLSGDVPADTIFYEPYEG